MKLSDLFKRLSFGPFSNIAIGNEGAGTILDAKKNLVISHINDALLRLHTRFTLIERELIVEMQAARTNYPLNSKNAVSYLDTDPAAPGFIKDSEADPFVDDLLKIMAVYTASGVQLPLNDDMKHNSVFTPQPTLLQVPEPTEGEPLYIIYRAGHVPIADNAPDTTVIDIPSALEEALISYVGYKVYDGMNGQEHTAKAQEYLGKYDNICAEVVEQDIVSSSMSFTGTKFDDRGFI